MTKRRLVVTIGDAVRTYRWTEKKEGVNKVWRLRAPKKWDFGLCYTIASMSRAPGEARAFMNGWILRTRIDEAGPFGVVALLAIQNASIGRLRYTICDYGTTDKPVRIQWCHDDTVLLDETFDGPEDE